MDLSPSSRLTRHQLGVVLCLLVLLVLVVILALAFGLRDDSSTSSSSVVSPSSPSPTSFPPRLSDPLTKPRPSESPLGNFSKAAIAVDGEPCANIAL